MWRRAFSHIDQRRRAYSARRAVAQWDRSAQRPPDATLNSARDTLARMLGENLLPFWFPRLIDRTHGGFHINHGLDGEWLGDHPKHLVSQARVLWFASRLMNSGRATPVVEQSAEHGFAFTRDRLWDADHGGFFWCLDAYGKQPLEADKHLYGQSIGMYAVAEYARASGDTDAAAMLESLDELLERHAYDPQHGGYREFFRRDWSAADPDQPSYMGWPPDVKQLNTHIHLLEAYTEYVRLTEQARARERLQELIRIEADAVLREAYAACTDVHHADWTPYTGPVHERANYGHDLENVWLIVDALSALGTSPHVHRERLERIVEATLLAGRDLRDGGFYYSGRLGHPADQLRKVWWVQAEGMVCMLTMYHLTGRRHYFDAFTDTLRWIDEHQIDWERGEWYFRVINGVPSGEKTGDTQGTWKSCYHNGRALVRCLDILDELRGELAQARPQPPARAARNPLQN